MEHACLPAQIFLIPLNIFSELGLLIARYKLQRDIISVGGHSSFSVEESFVLSAA